MLINISIMATKLTSKSPVRGAIAWFICPLPQSRQTSPYIYTVPMIFSPRNRLKAICLQRTSMAFLAILVKRARKALLYRWLNPKYCSTSAPRGCTRDEERFLEVGLQEQASNHLKLQR